jgi:hypothetical protein
VRLYTYIYILDIAGISQSDEPSNKYVFMYLYTLYISIPIYIINLYIFMYTYIYTHTYTYIGEATAVVIASQCNSNLAGDLRRMINMQN